MSFTLSNMYSVDPTTSPYFGAQDSGEGSFSLGGGDGSGYYDWGSSGLDMSGADFFIPGSGAGDNQTNTSIDPHRLKGWLGNKGYSLQEGFNDPNSRTRWVNDAKGNTVGTPQTTELNDPGFWNAALIAAAVTGAGAYGAGAGTGAGAASTAGGGAAASGATNAALIDSALGTAGYGASSAGAGGMGGGLMSAALKGAGTNAGKTALQGGDLKDILKSGAIGAVAGGAGSYVSDAYGLSGQNALAAKGAISGGVNAGLSGGSMGDVGLAAVTGGLSGYAPDAASMVGVENGYLKNAVNGGLLNGGLAALNGGDVGRSAVVGAIPGLAQYGGSLFQGDEMPDVGTLGGNMADADGETSATLGGEQTTAQYDANQSNYGAAGSPDVKTKASSGIGEFTSTGLGQFFSNLMPQNPQQFGSMAEGLMGMYAGHRQRRDAKKMMNSYNTNRGAYAQNLQKSLQRKDAASGRRSDYAGREVELQAKLAELDSRNAPGLAQLQNVRNQGLVQMLASGLRTGGKMGWFGDNAGAIQQPQPYQAPFLPSLAEGPKTYNIDLLNPNQKNKLGNGGG